ncbi:MAG: hypothetical protein JXR40_06165 [Pontiellaceae bacterium]|nr:hypothetical protein [Pontiellaceae bacterium]
MKTPFITLFVIASLVLGAVARPEHPLEQRLVTVRVTSQTWNEYRPWQKNKQQTRSFIGTVISGNRILMPAQDLNDAMLIQVEKYDRPPRLPARIVHCDQQIGLAVITVDEPGFFDDLEPVEIAPNADGEEYYCATWKSGQLSLAACRWASATVYGSSVPHLDYVKISFITDLTGGGWGEPLFCGNQLVGLCTSQNDNTVRALPAEQINAYINAVDNQSTYPGFAWLGLRYQMNKGPAQAAYLGLTGAPTGVRVCYALPGSSAEGVLEPGDVLLELDGHKIDSLGDYDHPRYGPLDLGLIASDGHYAGDIIKAKVLRDRKELTLDMPLKNALPSKDLIPAARINTPPAYLVAGGFIFRELDVPYLETWGSDWKNVIPPDLRTLYSLGMDSPNPEQRRFIILADVFADEYNLGYHDLSENIVKSVNGFPIDSIRQMEEAFQHPQEGFHVIEFMPNYSMEKVILDATQFEAATQSIMEKYQIPERIRLNPEPTATATP